MDDVNWVLSDGPSLIYIGSWKAVQANFQAGLTQPTDVFLGRQCLLVPRQLKALLIAGFQLQTSYHSWHRLLHVYVTTQNSGTRLRPGAICDACSRSVIHRWGHGGRIHGLDPSHRSLKGLINI